MPDRPDSACQLHTPPTGTRPWTRAEPGFTTCGACAEKLEDRLLDIARRYARLDPSPGAAGDYGSRGSPGFGSKPPLNVHVVAVTDPRSSSVAKVWVAGDGKVHRESERPPLCVFNELDTLAWDVCERRGFESGHGQDRVAGLCDWLIRQLDWVTRQSDVVAFNRSVRSIVTKLMPLTGDPRIWVAKCPNTLNDADGEHTHYCDANLYFPTSGDTIMCGNPACQRKWHRPEWNGDGPGCLSNLVEDRCRRVQQPA